MTDAQTSPSPVASVRPALTAQLQAETGLDDTILRDLVHAFYSKVRNDSLLGPIFAERISDWGPHLDRMAAFWSSVALMTGRYHGAPVPKHLGLPIDRSHFDRWLHLFRETAREVCPPAGAAHVIDRAERIARSLNIAVQGAEHGGVPNLS